MKTHVVLRGIVPAFTVAALAACSASQGFVQNVLPAGPASATRSAQRLQATVRIRIPHRHVRSHYISPATKSLQIVVQRVGSTTSATFNSNLTPASPGCSPVSGATLCTLKLTLEAGAYTSTFTTYDGPLAGGIPTGKKLSANQSVGMTIGKGKRNELDVALGGIPASATIAPGTGSALTGSGTNFTLPKCETSPQPVQVVGVDADGYAIIGAGASTASGLSSDDTTHLAVATPAPSTSPNAFTLVPPSTLTGSNVPNANGTVHLTAGVTPATGTGATPPPSSHVTITYSGQICGIFTEYTSGLTIAAEPFGLTRGPDGAMWFSEAVANNIGRISATGAIHEYPMTTKMGANYGIATGSDGNLWFTESNAYQIGKMTTSGTVTEFVTPTHSSKPWFIAAGPDGNLWFTEYAANQIGKIPTNATSGSNITEFPIPTHASVAYDIAPGPDNALWFVECGANQIARIPTNATSGADISEYLIPTSSAVPQYITAGPDGAMWFGECANTANSIGRVTTDGLSFTSHSIPTANSYPEGIVTGPDGALWFAESGTSSGKKIGRVTTDGTVTELTAPNSFVGGFQELATGPDGSIWFTETSDGIGRLR